MKILLEKEKKTTSFRSAYVQTLDQLIKEDQDVVVLEADLMKSAGTDAIFRDHPNNSVNFGISEANMISAAGGMSKAGLIPFAHSFAPFVTRRPLDQIYMSIAYSNNNLFIYASDAGIWSQRNGGTHTTNEDIAIMNAIPNCYVFNPSDPMQLKWLMRNYRENKGFYYVRCGRKNEIQHIYKDDSIFEVGKSIVLNEGTSKIAIIAAGMMVFEALLAAEVLREKMIDPTIVDMFSIKPYDKTLIQRLIEENDLILVAENHSRIGGIGSIIAYEIAKSKYKTTFKHIAIPDAFGEVGSLEFLKGKFKLNASDIVDSILEELTTN